MTPDVQYYFLTFFFLHNDRLQMGYTALDTIKTGRRILIIYLLFDFTLGVILRLQE